MSNGAPTRMRPFIVALELGRTDVEPPDANPDDLQDYFQQKLSWVTCMFGGDGRVHAKPTAHGDIDVSVGFNVRGSSALDVFEKCRSDLQTLGEQCRGFSIVQTSMFKLCLPKVEGERFSVSVRCDPDTNEPRYTSELDGGRPGPSGSKHGN